MGMVTRINNGVTKVTEMHMSGCHHYGREKGRRTDSSNLLLDYDGKHLIIPTCFAATGLCEIVPCLEDPDHGAVKSHSEISP